MKKRSDVMGIYACGCEYGGVVGFGIPEGIDTDLRCCAEVDEAVLLVEEGQGVGRGDWGWRCGRDDLVDVFGEGVWCFHFRKLMFNVGTMRF